MQIISILEGTTSKPGHPNIDVFNESSAAPFFGEKNYQAVVIIYTPRAEVSDSLFEIIRYIDERNPPGRFIFLPESSGEKSIPPIFHLIRSQQHHLFFYPLSAQPTNLIETQLVPFSAAWNEFTSASPEDKPGGGKGRPKSVPFWLILIASIFILILAGLIAVMIPRFKDIIPSSTPTPTPIHPPAATAFWLQEPFLGIDTATRWQLQHYYYGQQAIQTNLTGSSINLSVVPFVTDAVFQLDSRQSWPLDELQSLSFSFTLSAMDDPEAKTSLVFGLYLSEDSSYRVDCLIVPAATEGKIQCQVQSLGQVEPLSEPVPVSLNTKHSANLVFDPHTYTLQFFLDDTYYGQREIQSIEFWRTRNFNLQVREQVQNLSDGTFSCELAALNLSHQP